MVLEYNTIFNILDELKIEEEKTIETIRKSLFRTRPMILSRDQLEDYIKRIEFANEIMLSLDYLVKKTFDTYINFINIYWETTENSEIIERQKILSERYDMSMTEWQFILSKIERFNDIVKDFM
jgi:Fe-S-cluster containining protein